MVVGVKALSVQAAFVRKGDYISDGDRVYEVVILDNGVRVQLWLERCMCLPSRGGVECICPTFDVSEMVSVLRPL